MLSAASAHLGDLVAGYRVESALREYLFGNVGEARKDAKEASGASLDPDVRGGAALVLALSGDQLEAQKLADDMHQRFPEATAVRFVYLPAIQAALALRQGQPQKAIESLRTAVSYELVLPLYGPPTPLYVFYLRGDAYLAAHEGAEAAAEFQKVLDHRGAVGNAPIGALAHLGLGRAYALAGDTTKSRAAYQDFLTLWKDADPDIPVFKQAKAEYATLQ
jgi:tetratricopeptide (TPR) repeat protein